MGRPPHRALTRALTIIALAVTLLALAASLH